MAEDRILSELASYGRKKVHLDELKVIIGAENYSGLVGTVRDLQDCGVLKPVLSSGVNGSTPSLYLKYHIVTPTETDYSSQLREIKSLHYAIKIDKYLRSPQKYLEVRDVLYPLSEYLKLRNIELSEEMSENERAYAIWHDEKFLDDPRNLALLNDAGVLSMLNVYPTPEPFFKYQNTTTPDSVIVIENKDTWFSVRKLMLENQKITTLFGVPLECVVYGEGEKASRKNNSLQRYLLTGMDFHGNVYYWGDLDYTGIGIYLGVAKYNPFLHVEPLIPAYLKMLDSFEMLLKCSSDVREFACKKSQNIPNNMDEFFRFFPKNHADRLVSLLHDGLYIPQEILNYPTLKSCARC